MTIGEFAQISEIVSGVVVAITLLILVFQLRQNFHQQRAESVKEGVNGFVRAVVAITATRDRAENFLRGAHGIENMPSVDQACFHSAMLDLVAGFDQLYSLHHKGLIDEEHFLAGQRTFISLLKLPGAQQWWELFKINPPRGMVEHIDNVANSSTYGIRGAHEIMPWLMKRT